jgi:hypothetical protein
MWFWSITFCPININISVEDVSQDWLFVGLDISFDNIQDLKGLRYKAEKFISAKAYTYLTNYVNSRWILDGCYTSTQAF